jgi:predicted MFS family arabinose efflux permease
VALWVPVVVLAPVVDLLVDRLEARGLLLVVSLVQAAIAASLALAHDSVGAILVLAALLGVGFAVALLSRPLSMTGPFAPATVSSTRSAIGRWRW